MPSKHKGGRFILATVQVTLRTLVMIREILEIQWLMEWDPQNKKKLTGTGSRPGAVGGQRAKVQTSSYRISKSCCWNVQRGDAT